MAITNKATGQTVVHRFDRGDFDRRDNITFHADSINKDSLIADAQK